MDISPSNLTRNYTPFLCSHFPLEFDWKFTVISCFHIFSIDHLLPVQIGENLVGIVYRNGVPIQALMDVYDIGNKAILCDPSFDTRDLAMFKNSRFNRLRVVPDIESVQCGHVTHVQDEDREPVHPRCVTSVIPSSSPSPSLNSPQMEISPIPSMSTMTSWTPKFVETPSNPTPPNPVHTENPEITQNRVVSPVAAMQNPTGSAMPLIQTASALPAYSLNTDRFVMLLQHIIFNRFLVMLLAWLTRSFCTSLFDHVSLRAHPSPMYVPVTVPNVPMMPLQPSMMPRPMVQIPVPMMAVPQTDQLMQWMNQILVEGEHQQSQFKQYLIPRNHEIHNEYLVEDNYRYELQ